MRYLGVVEGPFPSVPLLVGDACPVGCWFRRQGHKRKRAVCDGRPSLESGLHAGCSVNMNSVELKHLPLAISALVHGSRNPRNFCLFVVSETSTKRLLRSAGTAPRHRLLLLFRRPTSIDHVVFLIGMDVLHGRRLAHVGQHDLDLLPGPL